MRASRLIFTGLLAVVTVTSLGGTPPSGYGTFWELSPSTEAK